MKSKLSRFLLGLFLAAYFLVPSAYAKPERKQIRNQKLQTQQWTAKSQIKNIDLKNIEDPEARKAIREIMNYLNLPYKK